MNNSIDKASIPDGYLLLAFNYYKNHTFYIFRSSDNESRLFVIKYHDALFNQTSYWSFGNYMADIPSDSIRVVFDESQSSLSTTNMIAFILTDKVALIAKFTEEIKVTDFNIAVFDKSYDLENIILHNSRLYLLGGRNFVTLSFERGLASPSLRNEVTTYSYASMGAISSEFVAYIRLEDWMILISKDGPTNPENTYRVSETGVKLKDSWMISSAVGHSLLISDRLGRIERYFMSYVEKERRLNLSLIPYFPCTKCHLSTPPQLPSSLLISSSTFSYLPPSSHYLPCALEPQNSVVAVPGPYELSSAASLSCLSAPPLSLSLQVEVGDRMALVSVAARKGVKEGRTTTTTLIAAAALAACLALAFYICQRRREMKRKITKQLEREMDITGVGWEEEEEWGIGRDFN